MRSPVQALKAQSGDWCHRPSCPGGSRGVRCRIAASLEARFSLQLIRRLWSGDREGTLLFHSSVTSQHSLMVLILLYGCLQSGDVSNPFLPSRWLVTFSVKSTSPSSCPTFTCACYSGRWNVSEVRAWVHSKMCTNYRVTGYPQSLVLLL